MMISIIKKIVASLGILPVLRKSINHYRNIIWSIEAQSFFSKFDLNDKLCFDIGANVGTRTHVFLKLGAQVVGVEPQNKIRSILIKKFSGNRNLKVVDKTISDSRSTLELSICDSDSGKSTLSNKWKSKGRFAERESWSKKQQVETITFDDLIEELGLPHLCKVDTEGFEYQVFVGLNTPIKYLLFQLAKEFISDTEKCLNRLLEISPYEFNICVGEQTCFEFNN